MDSLGNALSERLEPIAAIFRGMNVPEPITQWGHPLFMAIVALAMGGYVAYAGWQSRLATDPARAASARLEHRKVAPLMALFLYLGYTGGILSLVMQRHEILTSPHFWTGSLVLLLLAANGGLAAIGFGGQASLRTVHAWVGSALMGLLVIHGILGLKLGLSL
jgi:hypothetical protein